MKYSLPPPQYWQDFQELTQAVAQYRFPDSLVNIYGREGQDQHGIDVYVETLRIGIQAKSRRLFTAQGTLQPNRQIRMNEVEEIATEAGRFVPTLERLIVATTALRDMELQRQVIRLNEMRQGKSLFLVDIWFWEDFQADINNNHALLELHYNKILPKAPGFDPDAVLIATVSDAFHRPAMITPARCENSGDDFLQALKDVQEALATGVSHDRETRQVRSRALYGYPQAKDPRIRSSLKRAWEHLQQTRNIFTGGLSSVGRHGLPAIEQRNNFIEIRDPSVAQQINEERRRAIECVNAALELKECALILERDWF